jgi:adenine-specific DNA methylase
MPIAYLWARTVISEAPDDGTGIPVEVPLMRSLWLAKKKGHNRALRWMRDTNGKVQIETVDVTYADGVTRTVRRPLLEIFEPKSAKEVEEGTVARGAATCPVTGYTTPVESVRRQLKKRRGGASDARLLSVVTIYRDRQGRFYRLPISQDERVVQHAVDELERRKQHHNGQFSLVPNEEFPPTGLRRVQVPNYGIQIIGDLFSPRQALAITVFVGLTRKIRDLMEDCELAKAVSVTLSLQVDKQIDLGNSLCRWEPVAQCPRQLFARQSVPIVWDFAEGVPVGESSGSWHVLLQGVSRSLETYNGQWHAGQAQIASVLSHPLPDSSSAIVVTDPPYYDSVVYAHTADVFYPWLKRQLFDVFPELFTTQLCPKEDEIVVDPPHSMSPSTKDARFFETQMTRALQEINRITPDNGLSVIVFAHQSTVGWETMLKSMLDSNWVTTASWPIDTEMATRVIAQNRAVLASSIHLACRPHSSRVSVGDWRDVLQQLPQRIHAWLPRLAQEGVVGADAIFACLGPALEIFSRYSRVEKASGEQVTLKEYLEYVWAAVSKEALGMVFAGADATGFEEDARLTAMWLWTLRTDVDQANGNGKEVVASTGYTLEYDAARKIAQGLGAYLEKLGHLVEIKGSNARLLPVSARMRYLFGKEGVEASTRPTKKQSDQLSLFDSAEAGETAATEWGDLTASGHGETILDRVHQSMLLFAAGRSEALRRFLVEEGVGQDSRYWSLANALSALYPPSTDEKRWVDGVLARKKGLGF